MGPTDQIHDQTSCSRSPKGRFPSYWIWFLIRSRPWAHKSRLLQILFYHVSRLRFFGSTGQWVPLFQTSDGLGLHGRPGVPHMMAGIDLPSSGQMGPQQVLTTCPVSTKITPLLLKPCGWWPTVGPSPLGPWPPWLTRGIPPSQWSISTTQWARGPPQSQNSQVSRDGHVSVFHQTVHIWWLSMDLHSIKNYIILAAICTWFHWLKTKNRIYLYPNQ